MQGRNKCKDLDKADITFRKAHKGKGIFGMLKGEHYGGRSQWVKIRKKVPTVHSQASVSLSSIPKGSCPSLGREA